MKKTAILWGIAVVLHWVLCRILVTQDPIALAASGSGSLVVTGLAVVTALVLRLAIFIVAPVWLVVLLAVRLRAWRDTSAG